MVAQKKQLTNGGASSVETYIKGKYNSLLTKAGRGKARFGGVSVNKWAKKIFGNRVFDLYLKWGGIKMLTTATLVPLGLILSNDYIRSITNKKGGGLIPDKIPIIDNEVVGTYLKLAGLFAFCLLLSCCSFPEPGPYYVIGFSCNPSGLSFQVAFSLLLPPFVFLLSPPFSFFSLLPARKFYCVGQAPIF